SLRVPAWCDGAGVRVNGRDVSAAPDATGYVRLERAWMRGDVVELSLPMHPRLVEAHPWIESTRGAVAIERGPIVYCLEQADHPETPIADLRIDTEAALSSTWEPELLDGVVVVRGRGFLIDASAWHNRLYRPFNPASRADRRPVALTAIPYYAWANREPG